MGLQHDQRSHEQTSIPMVDVELQDEGHVDAADQSHANRMAQNERIAAEIGGKQSQVPTLAQLAKPFIDIAEMADRGGRSRPALCCMNRPSQTQLGSALDGGFKERS